MKAYAMSMFLILSGLFGIQAIAEPVTLYYADGSTVVREARISRGGAEVLREFEQRRGGGGVSLSTSVKMYETVNFQEIAKANPGQVVNFSTFFTALGSLSVPFNALVGRTFISATIAPTLDIFEVLQIPIEAGDENVVGYGTNVTIPAAAPLGPFLLVGLNRIIGVPTVDNVGTTVRLVSPAVY